MMSSEKRGIVEFFLNVFKLQMNLSGRAGQYRPISGEDGAADQIFELRVQAEDQWITRRMTISPLGEQSGSKSKCFKVIYDDMIVVKIPPSPVTDFSRYLESIQAEREIARHLEPEIRCVTPSLSAILRKIPPFSQELDTDFLRFEERCYQKLRILPVFEKYLKIGDGFAFFMNLSRYSFLGQIIAGMHDIREAVRREISVQTEILGNPMLFEEIYGSDGGIFFAMDGLYGAYEEALRELALQYGLAALSSFSRRDWFLSHLAGMPLNPGSEELPDGFIHDLNGLIRRTLEADPGVTDAYRKAMRRHAYRKRFAQNRARMGGVITNLLGNLAVLRSKKTAMRDLKPDNVFIAGDLSGDPFLLETPDSYSIGLIDFETSVVFHPAGGREIPQPMLAGTPSYATVSHLFTNPFLSGMHPSLERILHLQDWHAVNNMIYNVVTGRQMNAEAGRLMPLMIREMKASRGANLSGEDLYRKYSALFWRTALGEFTRKVALHHRLLADVRVQIPRSVREMLSEEIGCSGSAIGAWIRTLLETPSISLSPRDRDAVLKASSAQVRQLRHRWEKGAVERNLPEAVRSRVPGILSGLAKLKQDGEEMEAFLERISVPRPVVQAEELLRVMFHTVLYGMHRPEWGVITGAPDPAPGASASAGDPEAAAGGETVTVPDRPAARGEDSPPKRGRP